MTSLREARLRHAEYYTSALGKADTLYVKGGGDTDIGLNFFDIEQANIETGQLYAAGDWEQDVKAAAVCLEYAIHGRNILALRLQTSTPFLGG